MMVPIMHWPNLVNTRGVLHTDSWDHHFEWLEMHGDAPFRGDRQHPGWSPARFEPAQRKNEHVRDLYALVVDIDGTMTMAEALELWGGYAGGLMHTTRSHTPASHRLRVILPLSRPVTPEEHARLWQRMHALTGGRLDSSTRDPGRFWYVPGSSTGEPVSMWRLG